MSGSAGKTYIVAAIKPWNHAAFAHHRPGWAGDWELVEDPGALLERVRKSAPRYVFFPHWSWKVPAEILSAAECVCFHMTDVPYGRGGSPLQNLIARGHTETKLSALRMTAEMDAGPVYAKRPLSLDGRAQEIYARAAEIAFEMIGDIARDEPEPAPQTGEPTVFKRRTPDMSRLPAGASAKALYDHIRMLDAESYPPAFLEHGDIRLEFHDAALEGGNLTAKVVFREGNAE
jgi:methionyl-tRNA formyltransferase